MKKALKLKTTVALYHYVHGIRKDGVNNKMSGNCSNLYGDCSRLSGDCRGLRGDCTDLRGDCTELSGDLDNCELTEEERSRGINIRILLGEN